MLGEAMPPLRVMIDTNIFDALACDPDTFAAVIGLQRRGAIQLFITHLQEDQLAKAPPFIRKAVKALSPTTIRTDGAVWDLYRWDKAKWADDLTKGRLTRVQGSKESNSRTLVGYLDLCDCDAWCRCFRHQRQGCQERRKAHRRGGWSQATGLGLCRLGWPHRYATGSWLLVPPSMLQA